MKKSQILAALALAFSLGVVAPVAGLITSEGAYALDMNAKTATDTDVERAITTITNDATYNKYATLIEAYRAYTPDAVTAAAASWQTNVASGVPGLVSQINGQFAPLNVPTTTATKTSYEQLAETISNVTALKRYDAWKNLRDAYVAADNAATLKSAIATLMNNANWDLPSGTAKTVANYLSFVTSASFIPKDTDGTNLPAAYTYANVNALLNNIEKAQTTKNVIDGLKAALAKYNGGNTATVESDFANAAVIRLLAEQVRTILNTTTGGNFINTYDAIDNIRTLFENGKNGISPEGYYDLLDYDNAVTNNAAGNAKGLLQLFQTATDKHPEWTVTELVNAAPATPSTPNNPDEPGTDQPGTEEPGSEDPSAPGTGLVRTAEGNAATTVSIVAGLATALTALGAGVVAYRSARRSNK